MNSDRSQFLSARWRALCVILFGFALTMPVAAETVVKFGEDLEKVDPETQSIELKLESMKVNLDFEEVGIAEVFEFLRQVSGINIVLDPAIFEDRDAAELNVTLAVKDLSLKNSLKLILDLKNLVRTYKHGVMMISTPESLKKEIYFKVYDVRDLMFVLKDFPGPEITLAEDTEEDFGIDVAEEHEDVFTDPDSLLDMIRTNVEPESWDEESVNISLSNGLLIVTNTKPAQIAVRKFLDELRAMK